MHGPRRVAAARRPCGECVDATVKGMASHGATRVRTDLRAGDIGEIVRLHGILYRDLAGFDHTFEAYVAESVGECFATYDPVRDRVWIVEREGQVLGSLVLKGRSGDVAQLRYFLLHPALRGQGLGRDLMTKLLDFARAAGYRRIFLLTDEAVTPAATHLYVSHGFQRTELRAVERWGTSSAEQRYELDL